MKFVYVFLCVRTEETRIQKGLVSQPETLNSR